MGAPCSRLCAEEGTDDERRPIAPPAEREQRGGLCLTPRQQTAMGSMPSPLAQPVVSSPSSDDDCAREGAGLGFGREVLQSSVTACRSPFSNPVPALPSDTVDTLPSDAYASAASSTDHTDMPAASSTDVVAGVVASNRGIVASGECEPEEQTDDVSGDPDCQDLWNAELAYSLGPAIGKPDNGTIHRLDAGQCSSVSKAVEMLNSGALTCAAGICIVYSTNHRGYYLLGRADKKRDCMQIARDTFQVAVQDQQGTENAEHLLVAGLSGGTGACADQGAAWGTPSQEAHSGHRVNTLEDALEAHASSDRDFSSYTHRIAAAFGEDVASGKAVESPPHSIEPGDRGGSTGEAPLLTSIVDEPLGHDGVLDDSARAPSAVIGCEDNQDGQTHIDRHCFDGSTGHSGIPRQTGLATESLVAADGPSEVEGKVAEGNTTASAEFAVSCDDSSSRGVSSMHAEDIHAYVRGTHCADEEAMQCGGELLGIGSQYLASAETFAAPAEHHEEVTEEQVTDRVGDDLHDSIQLDECAAHCETDIHVDVRSDACVQDAVAQSGELGILLDADVTGLAAHVTAGEAAMHMPVASLVADVIDDERGLEERSRPSSSMNGNVDQEHCAIADDGPVA